MKRSQIDALNKMRKSRGRFFGLYTTQGNVLNAQFLGETENYITVFDRNNYRDRRLAKTSIGSVTLG